MRPKILIVEDNRKLAGLFKEALGGRFETRVALDCSQALGMLSAEKPDGLLLDVQLPDGDGLDLILPAHRTNAGCVIIVVTAYGTIPLAVEALRRGAADFLEKPVDLEALVRRFESLTVHQGAGRPVAESTAMREILEVVERVARTPFPVLITGPTGSGKEAVARYLHERSGREAFVALNCANVPPDLADSLLFGHLRGAFSGAVEDRQGLVAVAASGTLFLDEIGDLPLALQPKLLRFLDSGVFYPVGGTVPLTSDARVVAATNRNLEASAGDGTFREDLFFRLAAFPVAVSPLRDRPEDIIPLAMRHLAKLERLLGHSVELGEEAQTVLMQYPFPGNVRELFHILDRCAVMVDGRICGADLAKFVGKRAVAEGRDFWSATQMETERTERNLILQALERSGGNKAAAARMLGIGYKTLHNKIKKLGM